MKQASMSALVPSSSSLGEQHVVQLRRCPSDFFARLTVRDALSPLLMLLPLWLLLQIIVRACRALQDAYTAFRLDDLSPRLSPAQQKPSMPQRLFPLPFYLVLV